MTDPETKHKVLKGGEFIIRDSDAADVFTPEDFDEEQKMIRNMLRDFVEEIGDKAHQLEHQEELMDKAAELGLVGSHIPEEYGGTLLSINTNTLIADFLGAAGGSFNTTFAAHIGIGMLPILYFGTEEQKKKYLPKLCTAEYKAAYCLTEPSAGSDAMGIKTRADMNEDGTHYVLNGQKMWISNAGFADLFIVFAKIDGDKFTGFIVMADSEGISLGEEEDKLGIKGSSTRQVYFENVNVPKENVLGEIGEGHKIAFNALNMGRFKLGIMATGGARRAANISIRYATERKQFGKTIASFGAIQHKLAEQAIRIYVMESAMYRVSGLMHDLVASLLNEGTAHGEAVKQAARVYASECAIIKVAGSEYLGFVVDEMLQIHGGYGFSEEYPAARAYRDQRINRIYEGTNEINRLLLFDQIIKRAFKGELDLVGPAWEVQKELKKMPDMSVPEGPFGAEKKAVGEFKKILLMVAGAAAKAQIDEELNLREEQEIVSNISNIVIDTLLAESVLLRVQKYPEDDDAGKSAVKKAVLNVFLHDAQNRIVKNGTDALASFAQGDTLSILLKGLQRFSKFPPVNVKEERRRIAQYLISEKENNL